MQTSAKIKLKILNAVYVECSKSDFEQIKILFHYRKSYWKKGRYKKEEVEYDSYFCDKIGTKVRFLAGFLPRLGRFCYDKGIKIEWLEDSILPEQLKDEDYIKPKLPGITFRPDQEKILEAALKEQRGIILSATGTGKTIIAAGLVSAFPKHNILFAVHSIDIAKQTYEQFQEFFGNDVQLVYGETSKKLTNRIIVSTIQSLATIKDIAHYFDMIVIDEGHHAASPDGLYGKLLKLAVTPIRFGFTATLPDDHFKNLVIEGLIGPVISEFSINDAIEADVVSKPKLRIIRVPESNEYKHITNHRDVYKKCVVENKTRNRLILKTAFEYANQGMTSLISVIQVEHATMLLGLAQKAFPNLKIFVVKGEIDSDTRQTIRKRLNAKEIDCVIATSAWKEGIDIPTLDVVTNAGDHKSLIPTMQQIGRGIRRTKEKSEVIVVDVFDTNNWRLVSHFGDRMSIYLDNGWI
jgi:superfamily II DNA or RNA helicase